MEKKINLRYLAEALAIVALIALFIMSHSACADASTAAPKVDKSKITYYYDDVNHPDYYYVTVTLPSASDKLYYKVDSGKYKTSGTAKYLKNYPKVNKIKKSGKKVTLKIDIRNTKGGKTYLYLKAASNGKTKKVTINAKKGIIYSGGSDYSMKYEIPKSDFLNSELLTNATWISSDESVISIKDDKIVTSDPGTTVLTIESDGHKFVYAATVRDNKTEIQKIADYIKSNGSLSDDGKYYTKVDGGKYKEGYTRVYSADYYPSERKIVFTTYHYEKAYSGSTILKNIKVTVKMDRDVDDPIPVEYSYSSLGTYNGKVALDLIEGNATIDSPNIEKGWNNYDYEGTGKGYEGLNFSNLSEKQEKYANDLFYKSRNWWKKVSGMPNVTQIEYVGLSGVFQ